MTIKELKEILATWSEENVYGEDAEVWVSIGETGSKIVQTVCALNLRRDDDGVAHADIILETEWVEGGVPIEDMKFESYK